MSTLDLHGYTVHEAWEEFSQFIKSEAQDKYRKYSVVITGNGKIQQELPRWCDTHTFIRNVLPLERGAGFRIYFYRQR